MTAQINSVSPQWFTMQFPCECVSLKNFAGGLRGRLRARWSKKAHVRQWNDIILETFPIHRTVANKKRLYFLCCDASTLQVYNRFKLLNLFLSSQWSIISDKECPISENLSLGKFRFAGRLKKRFHLGNLLRCKHFPFYVVQCSVTSIKLHSAYIRNVNNRK